MKEIYYYNSKFPESGLKEIKIKDIQYTMDTKYKWISGIISNWDIDLNCEISYDRLYHIYTPYDDEEEIYVYDNNFGNQIIMSFNKGLIKEWLKKECIRTKQSLEGRLKKINYTEEKKMKIEIKIFDNDTEAWSYPVSIDDFILNPSGIEFEWDDGSTLPYNDFIFFGSDYCYGIFIDGKNINEE